MGRSMPDQCMTCACGEPNEEGHKDFCICMPGVKQKESHFQCEYKLKVVLRGPDFSTATIYRSSRNAELHVLEPGQKKQSQMHYKLPESVKNEFDNAKLKDKVTAAKFGTCMNRCSKALCCNRLVCLLACSAQSCHACDS